MKKYDLAIVGTGPAAMMCALELTERRPDLSIVMFEMGKVRTQAEVDKQCENKEKQHSITEGWGGAGARSDGKYNHDTTGKVGGSLVGQQYMSSEDWNRLLIKGGEIYVAHGGDSKRLVNKLETNAPEINAIKRLAFKHNMDLHAYPILHLGTSTALNIVNSIRQTLLERDVDIITECKVENFKQYKKHWRLNTQKGAYNATRVLVAPGRVGSSWLGEVAQDLGLEMKPNGLDIGVRVEVPQYVMSQLTDLLYEAKIYFKASNGDPWRTFCMCPNGHVAIERYEHMKSREVIYCANGHSDSNPENKSKNCNFAILGTQRFEEPFDQPMEYIEAVAGLATKLSKSVIVQLLGDIVIGRRSRARRLYNSFVSPTCPIRNGSDRFGALPGDLTLAAPARYVNGMLQFLEALDHIAPGINSKQTLLYFPEVKFYPLLYKTTPEMGFETSLEGFHVAGDGSGYTRGLNGASIMGLYVGEKLANIL